MIEKTHKVVIPVEKRASAGVAIVRTKPGRDQVIQAVQEAMQLANWREFISPSADVSLKANLGWDKLIPGAISAPWVVEGVIETIRDHVHRIYLVESDQIAVDVEKVFRISNLDKVCERYGVQWVNMSKGDFIEVKDSERAVLKDIRIPEILARTELITLPVMKTHNKTTITGALKNQWGCLETLRHNFHLQLTTAIADVNALVQPHFAVMDGTVGLEGNGPKSGRPKQVDLILASGNLVGIDTIAARIMGFNPDLIPHLLHCAKQGLGSLPGNESVIGPSVEQIAKNFIPANNNVVSWMEFNLRKSFFHWLVFETPILYLMAWGSSRYYDLWDLSIGRSIRKQFFSTSDYAAQWVDRV